MNFVHELLPKYELKEIFDADHGKSYITPSGNYQSVTNFLSDIYKFDREKFEKDFGKENATRISKRATTKGTAMHKIAEQFLLNDPEWNQAKSFIHLDEFKRVKPILEKNVTKVYGTELKVFSDKLKLAGTVDLACDWTEIPSVIDYKTSNKIKFESEIENYFVQAAIYGMMIKELYGIDIRQIVIILLVEFDIPIIFIRNINDYQKLAENLIENYNQKQQA